MALKYLYKYRSTPKHIKDIITNHCFYVPSPSDFSDKADCNLKINLPSIEAIIKSQNSSTKTFKSYLPPQDLLELIRENHYNMWDKVREKFGIISMCLYHDVEKMWEEYADNGNGVCFEFDINYLFANADWIAPVTYADDDSVKLFSQEQTDIKKMLTYKNTSFQHEHEIRIFKQKSNCQEQNNLPTRFV